MIPIRGTLPALIVTGLLIAAFPAGSDVGPIVRLKGGGAAAPGSPHQAIRLDSQEVTIRLRKLTYEVDAVFHFFNTAASTTEWVGFPKWVETSHGSHALSTFIRFDAWVRGRQVKFSDERDLSLGTRIGMSLGLIRPPPLLKKRTDSYYGSPRVERLWLIHQVRFPGHAQTTIRVAYKAPYYYNPIAAIYLYGTGSLWKGTIGKAVFIVDSSEVGGTETTFISFEKGRWSENIRLRPWSISRNVVRYEMTDVEPDPEARLVVNPYCLRAK